MRAVVQRVTGASVVVDGTVVGTISTGLLILLGVHKDDTQLDADYLAPKLVNLRIFDDEEGRLNRSVKDIGGAVLVVSQFTLYGDCRKGRRPSYDQAAPPEKARALYEYFVERMRSECIPVETGTFQASMSVELTNDGPVTLICDSVTMA
jgi:D-tyrosyl-tRNA(Tyr) deacylase